MSICPDLGPDLLAYQRGELDGDAQRGVEQHVAACRTCAATLSETAAFLERVRAATEIEPSPAEVAGLAAAVDGALDGVPSRASVPPHPSLSARLRSVWDVAIWSYETSARFRRVTLGSLGVHAAAAAVLGWLLIGGAVRSGRPEINVAGLEPPIELTDEPMAELPYEPATPEGVPLPGVFARGASDIRFPTRGIRAHLAIACDPSQKAARLRSRLGDELAVRAGSAIERGLTRLTPGAGGSVAADAAIVLAFCTDGRSARVGDSAERLGPAVEALEEWLGARVATEPASEDFAAYSLAVRALTWQWALDFRHLDTDERLARLRLLQRAGRRLVERQDDTGGFGDATESALATAALADLRLAGVMRPDEALQRAGRHLDSGDLALAAVRLAYPRELGIRSDAAVTLDALSARLVAPQTVDPLLCLAGLQALVRHRRPLRAAMDATLAAQRDDGTWSGGDLATALGVLAVARGYMPDS